jgi:hypothetical protein
MSLCSLCQTIPFEGLGSLPECTWGEPNQADPEDPASVFSFRMAGHHPPNEPLGFLHHNSREILAASAETCGLCDYLHSSLNAFFTGYWKALNDPDFRRTTNERFSLSSEFQLFLTRRSNGGDGFLIMVRAEPKEFIYMLGAVSLCVEDSEQILVRMLLIANSILTAQHRQPTGATLSRTASGG